MLFAFPFPMMITSSSMPWRPRGGRRRPGTSRCRWAEAILGSGARVALHEGMGEDYVMGVADVVREVARHHAA